LLQELGREPTDVELADKMNLPLKKIQSIKKAMIKEPISLNMQIAEDLSLEDYVPDDSYMSPETNIQEIMLEKDIQKLLKTLNERERLILIARFGLNSNRTQTLEDIGNMLGFSKERIRQIQEAIICKIRSKEKFRHLREYLN